MYEKDYVLSNGQKYVRGISDNVRDHLVVQWTLSIAQAERFSKPTAETLGMNFDWQVVSLKD